MKAVGLSLLITCTALAANAPSLSYAPHAVRVSGIVRRETFPGRPNYEDLAKGDEPETQWILDLDFATDVVASLGDPLDSAERDVRSMQLVFDGALSKKSYADYPGVVGQHVIVSGQLFHAHTGHHRTAVLISVRDVKEGPLNEQRPDPPQYVPIAGPNVSWMTLILVLGAFAGLIAAGLRIHYAKQSGRGSTVPHDVP